MGLKDFRIEHGDATRALGLPADALTGLPLAYRLHPANGKRDSWASDITLGLQRLRQFKGTSVSILMARMEIALLAKDP